MKGTKALILASLGLFLLVGVSTHVAAQTLLAYWANFCHPNEPQLNYTTQFVFSNLVAPEDTEISIQYFDSQGDEIDTVDVPVAARDIEVVSMNNLLPACYRGDGLARITYDERMQLAIRGFFWNFGDQSRPGYDQAIGGSDMGMQSTTLGMFMAPGFWHYATNPGQSHARDDIYVTHLHMANASEYPIKLQVEYHLNDGSVVYHPDEPVEVGPLATQSFMTNNVFGDGETTPIENTSGWMVVKQFQVEGHPKTAELVFELVGEQSHFTPDGHFAQVAWATYDAFYPVLLPTEPPDEKEPVSEVKPGSDSKLVKVNTK